MKTTEEAAIASNSGQSAIVGDAPTPIDTTPKPVIAGALGESLGNREDARNVVEPSRTPSAQPLDLDAAVALAVALDALLAASLIAQARPIARELRSVLEGAQEPRATVIDLGSARGKR